MRLIPSQQDILLNCTVLMEYNLYEPGESGVRENLTLTFDVTRHSARALKSL